ncbi:zinc finger protein 385D [Dendroctonus ponderosae]|uniref:C2H2-type domain-containing protein n=1 Tax=Dendroctonus ponderosae TaxID=77166 RepID=U4UQ30_DENPD|nr:zinc finger protein 385D [Dendroctonus ponderosae]ERL92246.1 hypothetical protein D910_09563 [Dendroctonus ponderosae]KAH1004925.1 hypothetical protein HUJ05_005690 [Dendroctonus ponderosae]
MSGNLHSGVQDVAEILDDDPDINRRIDEDFHDDLSRKVSLGSPGAFSGTHFNPLSSQMSTVSNTSDGALFCEICNIRVTSTKILQRHLEGRKHKSRAERRGKSFHCDLCEVTANSEIQLNIHLSSSKHKSRVAREEYKEFFDVSSYSKSMYVLLFAVFCIILNLIILVKVAM